MLIVSCDGGGIRGLFTARLLERLELAAPGFLASVSLFAGTSTGGILAAALAAGLSPTECVALYRDHAGEIFSASWEHQLASLWSCEGPKYSGAGLRAVLTRVLGDRKMRDLRQDVVITSCDARLREAVRFTRQDHPDLLVVEACMRTSAAEVYFPPIDARYFDGGNAANNPSLWGVIHQLSLGTPLRAIRLLALGTGNANRPPMTLGEWGARQWLENGLLSVMLEYPASLTDRLCHELLGPAYYRLDGSVNCAMDDSTELDAKLIAPADALDISGALAFIEASRA